MASRVELGPFRAQAGLRPSPVELWLWLVAGLVLAMVAVGGITRLTESGLSITEWRPVSGIVPPLTEAGWQAEFDKYRQIPEYQQLRRGMSMAEFQFIYWWEYVHRLLGRTLGLAYVVPLVVFWARHQLPHRLKPRLVLLALLGGLQGVVGWWMVASGLSERTDVSPYRLAVHLNLALLLLALLVWTARDVHRLERGLKPARLRPGVVLAASVLAVQLVLGAFVAGLNAGYVASDWPLMQGRFFPDGVVPRSNLFETIAEDPFLAHFLHRWWAWATVAALGVLAAIAWRRHGRLEGIALGAALGVQMLLGIAVVVSGMNFWLAVLHQGVGAVVVAATALAGHRLGIPLPQVQGVERLAVPAAAR